MQKKLLKILSILSLLSLELLGQKPNGYNNKVNCKINASIIGKFAKNTNYPDQESYSVFKIGILGEENKELYELLVDQSKITNYAGNLATNRNLKKQIFFFEKISDIIPTQMLFASTIDKNEQLKVFQLAVRNKTLLLSENFLDFKSTMIDIIYIANRPQYTLNETNLKTANYKLDSNDIQFAVKKLTENNDVYEKLKAELLKAKDDIVQVNADSLKMVIDTYYLQNEKLINQEDDIREREVALKSKNNQFDAFNEMHQNTINTQKQKIKQQEGTLKKLEKSIDSKVKILAKHENEIGFKNKIVLNQKYKIQYQLSNIKKQRNILKRQFSEIQRQKIVIYLSGLVIILIFSLAIIIYKSYLEKKKVNSKILEQKNEVEKQMRRSDELLLNILPSEVAEELKSTGSAQAKQFDEVTVMFTDFKGFTQVSEKLSPTELVNEIHSCFKAFDAIITRYNIEKIKTIGDSYMCAGGLPVANKTHADDVVKAALEIRDFMLARINSLTVGSNSGKSFEIRIGIHTGTVVAGIVGVKKFAYDIWGDTVNTASRMESSGEVGKVNISGSTYEMVKDKFTCEHRGKIAAKNKGEIDMYFVETIT